MTKHRFNKNAVMFTFLVINLITFNYLSSIYCSHGPKLLLISFDGFRGDYLNSDLTPNLFKLAKNGVHGEHMRPVFVTKTFPNHFSIVTGYYEETHGIIGNHFRDSSINGTFKPGVTDSRWWDNGLSIPIWMANEIVNDGRIRHSGAIMFPGSDSTYSNKSPRYLQVYNKGLNWDKRINLIIEWFTSKSEPANFICIYFDEPDSTAHKFGPFSNEVNSQIKRIDNTIGYLIKKLNENDLKDSVNMIILSDHGMAEIKKENLINLDDILSKNYYDYYGESPVYHLKPKSGYEKFVYDKLKDASTNNNFTIYKKSEIPDEYHYKNNARVLPLIVVADEGYDLSIGQWKGPRNSNTGNHGYNNSLPSMRPLFIANGPAFKRNFVFNQVFENIDIYPLMNFVLQIQPASKFPSNGSFDRVSDMLISVSIQRVSVESDKVFAMILVVGIGFAATFFGGIILLTCITCSRQIKEEKNNTINWDANDDSIIINGHNRVSLRKVLIKRSNEDEGHLLLDDHSEEEV